MAKFFQLLLACAYSWAFLVTFTVVCPAQSSNGTPRVDDVQLSISLTNNVIPAGSMFSIFTEMTNTSTNVIYLTESTPEQDFSIFLTSPSGVVYQISRTPGHIAGATVQTLNPGDKHDWSINSWVSRYYEPPGYTPTHQNVPAGNYKLRVTRKIATRYKVFKVESNVAEIQIK